MKFNDTIFGEWMRSKEEIAEFSMPLRAIFRQCWIVSQKQILEKVIEILEDKENKAPTCRINKALEVLKKIEEGALE